jgi:hypothetical protein
MVTQLEQNATCSLGVPSAKMQLASTNHLLNYHCIMSLSIYFSANWCTKFTNSTLCNVSIAEQVYILEEMPTRSAETLLGGDDSDFGSQQDVFGRNNIGSFVKQRKGQVSPDCATRVFV